MDGKRGFHSPGHQQTLNEQLVEPVRLVEERAEKKRRVLGRERLFAQVFDTTIAPNLQRDPPLAPTLPTAT